jgi:hypothetical protein
MKMLLKYGTVTQFAGSIPQPRYYCHRSAWWDGAKQSLYFSDESLWPDSLLPIFRLSRLVITACGTLDKTVRALIGERKQTREREGLPSIYLSFVL